MSESENVPNAMSRQQRPMCIGLRTVPPLAHARGIVGAHDLIVVQTLEGEYLVAEKSPPEHRPRNDGASLEVGREIRGHAFVVPTFPEWMKEATGEE